jgi:hypothetical protein
VKEKNDEKHALRVSHVRVRRQMGMQAFPLALCLRANKTENRQFCIAGLPISLKGDM